MPLPMGVANAGAKLILNDLLDSQVETAVSRLRADIPMAMVEGVAAFVVEHRPSSLIRRASSVEEVANMVVYVAYTQASSTTGAALRVDGGVVDTLA
ncbi:short chain dehydrogenase [compost metagenome]